MCVRDGSDEKIWLTLDDFEDNSVNTSLINISCTNGNNYQEKNGRFETTFGSTSTDNCIFVFEGDFGTSIRFEKVNVSGPSFGLNLAGFGLGTGNFSYHTRSGF